ncbi:Protein of unknown function [Pyronema omphalodes CBS 100304]|uniref:Uncharacterized protein n=1 Tax=Pyronema omphalodes (strain CBS 100304) TaxID=1076935 RepID=U4L848_PYROM|nr:Protein of unknown function [Pyronema omphalodes CBS 100304]
MAQQRASSGTPFLHPPSLEFPSRPPFSPAVRLIQLRTLQTDSSTQRLRLINLHKCNYGELCNPELVPSSLRTGIRLALVKQRFNYRGFNRVSGHSGQFQSLLLQLGRPSGWC